MTTIPIPPPFAEQPRCEKATIQEILDQCPSWCASDHQRDIETGEFRVDVTHARHDTGPVAGMHVDGEGEGIPVRVLGAILDVHPFSESLHQRLPNVSVEIVDGHWVEDMDPAALANLIAMLRGRLDDLDRVHAQLLAARAEWEAKG